jgi:hypothetical protein
LLLGTPHALFLNWRVTQSPSSRSILVKASWILATKLLFAAVTLPRIRETRVRFSTWRLAFMSEVSNAFCLFLHTDCEREPEVRWWQLPSTSLTIHCSNRPTIKRRIAWTTDSTRCQPVDWIAPGLTTDWTAGGSKFESLQGKEFSLHHVFQTGSGAHPTSYQVDTGGSFPGAWSWPLTSN